MLPIKSSKIRRLGHNRKRFIYSTKTYSNPFFRRNRSEIIRPSGPSSKRKLLALAAIAAAAIIIWLLFFSTLFKIQNIKVSGADDYTAGEIIKLAQNVAQNRLVGKNNLMLFDKSELIRQLNEKYYLADLSVKKRPLHTLIIDFKQKQQAAVWQEDGKYYFLDDQAKVITQVDPLNINRNNYPLIENQTPIKIDGRQANLNKITLDYIISLFNEFKDSRHGFEIEKFIVDREANTVKLAVLSGPKLFFNTRADMLNQAAKLDLMIKDKLKDSFKAKEYLILGIGEGVYTK